MIILYITIFYIIVIYISSAHSLLFSACTKSCCCRCKFHCSSAKFIIQARTPKPRAGCVPQGRGSLRAKNRSLASLKTSSAHSLLFSACTKSCCCRCKFHCSSAKFIIHFHPCRPMLLGVSGFGSMCTKHW